MIVEDVGVAGEVEEEDEEEEDETDEAADDGGLSETVQSSFVSVRKSLSKNCIRMVGFCTGTVETEEGGDDIGEGAEEGVVDEEETNGIGGSSCILLPGNTVAAEEEICLFFSFTLMSEEENDFVGC